MKRTFLFNLFLVVGLNLLIKPFYIIGIDAEVQNRVGEEIYGNYFSLLNVSFLLNIVLDFGISNYYTRKVASNPNSVKEQFYSILALRIILFFAYVLLTLTGAYLTGFRESDLYLLGVLAINQFLVAVIQFCRANFAGLHLFKTDSLISVLDRALLILFCSVLLWTEWIDGEFQIEWFVYAQTAAYGIAALISVALLIPRTGSVLKLFSGPISFSVLKSSFPFALLILLMMCYSRIDAVLIERMREDGDVQAGIYTQGFRFLDAANMFALLFAGLLLPIFSRLISQKRSTFEIAELAFRILTGASLITAMTCFFLCTEIIELRYPQCSENADIIFGFLILSFIPVSLGYVFGTLLTANGSLKILNYIALIALVVSVVLNLITIPRGGALGASIVALITQWVAAILQIVFAYRTFKYKLNIKLYTSLITLCGVTVATHFLNSRMLMAGPVVELFTLVGLALVFAFATGIFRVSDLRTILSKSDRDQD